MKASKQCLVVVDEYGDGIKPEIREGKWCLSPEEQELLRLDKYSKLQTGQIIISHTRRRGRGVCVCVCVCLNSKVL